MTPADLRRHVLRLDPGGPIHQQLEARLATGRRARPWYRDQREHLLGWLGEYGGPGAYGRASGDRTAAFVYSRFQCAPGLAWLAEAAGVAATVVTAACEAAAASGSNRAAQCGAFRKVIPWRMLEARLQQVGTPRRETRVGGPRITLPAGANDNARA